MTDVDLDRMDLLTRIGICFKIGAEGSVGVAAQGNERFLCSTNRIWQKPYLSDVCSSCKELFKFRATVVSLAAVFWMSRNASRDIQKTASRGTSVTADRRLSRLGKKGGSVGNTRLLPHAKMLLVPMNCFLCGVDYALEENVLTEQMWSLAAY